MPQINEPRELFAYKLSKAHASEQAILEMLQTIQEEVSDQELKQGFERHAQETEGQIRNLEQALDAIGEKPQEQKPRIVEALRTDHNEFTRQSVPPELLDAFIVGAALHTEHHEISTYETLITMAEAMGEQDVVPLLQENLEQEQNTLQQVTSASQRLAQQVAQLQTAT